MRLQEILKGEPAKQLAEMFPPFGPGFPRTTIDHLEALQVHCSDFRAFSIHVFTYPAAMK